MLQSFGFGELTVVVLLAVLLFDAREVARVVRWLRGMRGKLAGMHSDLKMQIDSALDEFPEAPSQPFDKSSWRKWAANRIQALPSREREAAALAVVDRLTALPEYASATCIAAYASLPDELDSAPLLRRVLADRKILALPKIEGENMVFLPVTDLDNGLTLGTYGIREPVQVAGGLPAPPPDLIAVPGRCFDASGTRLGRGGGFYDRWLAVNPGTQIGIGYETQVSSQPLPYAVTDIKMSYILTEKRTMITPEQAS